MINIIFSTYKKNRSSIKRAVPWTFMYSRITTGVFGVIFPYFTYTFFLKGNITSEFNAYTNGTDYITYIVLGSALNVLAVSTLMNIGRALITEMREGTLEPFLLSPASRIGYFIGCLFEQTSRALIEFGVVIAAGLLLGAKPGWLFSLSTVLVILLAVFSFFCLSITLSSVMLYTRDTYITQNTLFNLMTFICGVMFPIEYLPHWLQIFAQIFPLTPAVKLFRLVVINNQSIITNFNLILQILLLCVIYLSIGLVWFKKIEKKLMESIFG